MRRVATRSATSGAWQTFLVWATDVDPQSHVGAFGCCAPWPADQTVHLFRTTARPLPCSCPFLLIFSQLSLFLCDRHFTGFREEPLQPLTLGGTCHQCTRVRFDADQPRYRIQGLNIPFATTLLFKASRGIVKAYTTSPITCQHVPRGLFSLDFDPGTRASRV